MGTTSGGFGRRGPGSRERMDTLRPWPLIALGAASFCALTFWLLQIGLWWLVAGVVAVSVHAGYVAWREGLPLWPGGPPREPVTRSPAS